MWQNSQEARQTWLSPGIMHLPGLSRPASPGIVDFSSRDPTIEVEAKNDPRAVAYRYRLRYSA